MAERWVGSQNHWSVRPERFAQLSRDCRTAELKVACSDPALLGSATMRVSWRILNPVLMRHIVTSGIWKCRSILAFAAKDADQKVTRRVNAWANRGSFPLVRRLCHALVVRESERRSLQRCFKKHDKAGG